MNPNNDANEALIVPNNNKGVIAGLSLRNTSNRDANSIKNLLNKLGVNLDKIRVVGKGEERLAIPTPDEIPHPANRRAIIKASY